MPKYGKWKTGYRCTSCRAQMTSDEAVHSCGTCPHCGFFSGGLYVSAEIVAYRKVYGKWWRWLTPEVEWRDE